MKEFVSLLEKGEKIRREEIRPALVHSKLTPLRESRIKCRQDNGSQEPWCYDEKSENKESKNGGPKRWPAVWQIPWASRSLCGNRVKETKVVGTTPKLDKVTGRSAESSVVEQVRAKMGSMDLYLCREIRLAKYSAIVRHIDGPEGTWTTPPISTFIPPKQFRREHTCNRYIHTVSPHKKGMN